MHISLRALDFNVKPHWTALHSGPYADPVSDDESKLRKAFGQRLQVARLAKDLTQDQVAGRFSIEKNTVSAWETGRGVPDALRLRALAKLYDTSADALLLLSIEVVHRVTDEEGAPVQPDSNVTTLQPKQTASGLSKTQTQKRRGTPRTKKTEG